MYKKIFILAFSMFFSITIANASSQVKVAAMDNFQTDNPSKNIKVRVLYESEMGKYQLQPGTVINCEVLNIVDPKRGKRNASFFVKPINYYYEGKKYKVEEEMYGKYSRRILSKEELKQIPPMKVVKNAALTVGNYFVKGISIAYHFTEGIVKNEKDNRLKSGITNAYEESPLSLVNEGDQLDIKIGDDFYLVFKSDEDETPPNYSYTEETKE